MGAKAKIVYIIRLWQTFNAQFEMRTLFIKCGSKSLPVPDLLTKVLPKVISVLARKSGNETNRNDVWTC